MSQSAALVGLPLVLAWILVIALRGGYDRGVFGAGADEYKIVVGSSLVAAAILGIGCYLTQFELSRGFFLFTFLIGPALLTAGRYLLRRWLHRARRHGGFGAAHRDRGQRPTTSTPSPRSSAVRPGSGTTSLGAVTPASDSTVATAGGVACSAR